jgi:hypothetical protein
MADKRMQNERAVGLVAVQEDGNGDDRKVGEGEQYRDIAPPRQVK